jgi:selenide,water dikinase
MQATAGSVQKHIVLIGGGHSHVVVLRLFALRPLPGVSLTVVCTDTETPYSGMLPGYIAGHYSFADVHINLQRLADFAGVRYINDAVIGIDRQARKVLCRNAAPIAYDALSLNIGSTPQLAGVPGASEHAIPVKPIRSFNERWLAVLERVRRKPGAMAIGVVGAGAGGVELTLSMQYRLRQELRALGRDPEVLSFHLFSADPHILATHNARVRRAFDGVLAERRVNVHRSGEVVEVAAGYLWTKDGRRFAVDEVFWVTQAGGAAWLKETGLALDDRGFVRVRESLQTETDPLIFAAGDCAALVARPLEKAGVFAVRMGPPLYENLCRCVLGQPMHPFRPQQRWLALISTGDRHAIASRGAFYARGDLVWRWKDWIDRRFMRRFNKLDRQG